MEIVNTTCVFKLGYDVCKAIDELKEAGFTTEQILLYTIIKELDYEDMKIISQRFDDEGIEPSIYSEGFKKMILKKA